MKGTDMKKSFMAFAALLASFFLTGCTVGRSSCSQPPSVSVEDGKDGSSFLTGHGEPSSSTGNDGDTYLDLDTYDLYVKGNGQWSLEGNIKGEPGSQGN